MDNEHESQGQQPKKFPWWEYVGGNWLSEKIWNRLFPRAKVPSKNRQGEHEITSLRNLYQTLLAQNDGMITNLSANIEEEWKIVEEAIYGKGDIHYQKDAYGSHIIDVARQAQYFKDFKLANDESNLFLQTGTVGTQDTIVRGPNISPVPVKTIVPNSRPVYLPGLGVDEIVAMGPTGYIMITNTIKSLSGDITTLATRPGFDARLRGELPRLTNILSDNFKKFQDLETQHGQKLGQVSAALEKLEEAAGDDIVQHRAPVSQIRFPHSYKIIEPKALDRNGREKVFDDRNLYRNFRRTDELAAGLDENGYPLEVFEYPDHSNQYYVLVDRWWEELSMNSWHKETIKGKTCGEQKWRDKVDLVAANPGPHATALTIDGIRYRTIRKVPDSDFVKDLDPSEKLGFLSNEWDAFRDDRRDGRWHRHSKTIMCYILERKLTPTTKINFDIDTKKLKTRIDFIPIYYTSGQNKGKFNQRGGLGNVKIPSNEQKVSRVYNMEVFDTINRRAGNRGDGWVAKPQVRTPSHLNPAFDRAALNHEFIHWGRMFYYEGVEGINRWSENPFPHITTRGMSKYVIDLVLRDTFSFKDAREILRGSKLGEHKYDYGIRHYGEPYTLDPLGPAEGPGGALWHGKQVAEK